jgi:hypothetical protein
LAGGKLYSYQAGTSTPLATYSDSVGTPNANPLILDAYGQGVVYLNSASVYKFNLLTSAGAQVPNYPRDNISPTLPSTGNAAFGGNVTIAGTLGVTGATTLSSTLGVTGAATFASSVAVTGAATLSSTLALTGNATLAAGLAWAAETTLTGSISPAQITANQNNYNPTGLATATILNLTSDAARDITGIVAQSNGRLLVLMNSGGYTITLKENSGSSSAANRFYLPGAADYGITLRNSLRLLYVTDHWQAW